MATRAALRYATVVTRTEREAADLAGGARLVPRPTALQEPPGRAARLVAIQDSAWMQSTLTGLSHHAIDLPALVLRLCGPRLGNCVVRGLASVPIARVRGFGARLALAAGDIRCADHLSRRALSDAPAARSALGVQAVLLERAGEPSAALGAARAGRERRTVRRLEGLFRTFDVASAHVHHSRSVAPTRPATALVLLETSLPHSAAGYAFRSEALVQALSRAGLEPVVVTRLGFPASRGVTDFAAVEYVDGVVHHRLSVPGARRYTAIPPMTS